MFLFDKISSNLLLDLNNNAVEGFFSILQDEGNASDGDDESDSDGSGSSKGSTRIEMAFQLPSIKPHDDSSFIPNKVGELVRTIHLSLVCRALRKYISGRRCTYLLMG